MDTNPWTLGGLAACFFAWLDREVAAGRTRPATAAYYRLHVGRFVAQAGGDLRLDAVLPWHLERCKTGWHSVQAVQRLFNWAVGMGLLPSSPVRRVERPRPGQRRRILTRAETTRLLRACRRPFRRFLVALRHTLARPQELRALRWEHLAADRRSFVLSDFKGRDRRRDGVAVRVIPLDGFMRRLVRRGGQGRSGAVFLNSKGRPWSANALRCAMRRARRRAGLLDGGELVVCYTFRHTAATEATAAGVLDRRLAELLGHASTRTTARYQHLATGHLVEAVEQATGRRRPA